MRYFLMDIVSLMPRTQDTPTTVTRAECFHLNEILGDKSLPGCRLSQNRPPTKQWWNILARRENNMQPSNDSDPLTTVTDRDCARLLGLLTEEMKNVDHADDNLPLACRNYIGKSKLL
jgi:hypothetical protein